MDGKLAKVRFATFCKFVLRGPPPRRELLAFVRWLASRRVVRSSAVRSFVLRWFVRLRPQQENGKGKPVSSAATDGRMAQEGRGEEEERRWLWRRRRRFPSLPLELGAGSSSRSSLFRSLSRSHAAGRLSDPVLKIDGGSMQLSFSLPRLDDRLLSLSSSSFARRTRNR